MILIWKAKGSIFDDWLTPCKERRRGRKNERWAEKLRKKGRTVCRNKEREREGGGGKEGLNGCVDQACY